MSLRVKMVLTIVLSVVIAVLSCGLIIRQSVAAVENDRLRAQAAEQLNEARDIYNETGVLTLNASVEDKALPESARTAARAGQTVTMITEVDGRSVVFAAGQATVGTHEAVISVQIPMADSIALLDRVDQAIVLGVLISGGVVAIVGSLVAGRISSRLTFGAAAARRIANGDTSVRVSDEISTGNDEVATFAQTVDQAVAQLRDRLDSEQRFTADLAHEMRTPLTGLINAAALLEDSRPAQLVKDRVRRLQTLVEDLLEVSRLDTGREQLQFAAVGVDQTVTSLVTRMLAHGELSGHQVEVIPTADGAVIHTEMRRLERILGNLLINAAKHGGDPIVVRTTPEFIEISDNGRGYPEDVLAHGPTRFVSSGSGGMGLGLVIAQGQARVLGMELAFCRAPSGGALTRVSLPAPAEPPPPHARH